MSQRMTSNQSVPQMMKALTGNNPGSMEVLQEIMTRGEEVELDEGLGGLGALMSLDIMEVYDDEIWDLYKMCGQDVVKTVACVRGSQMGIIPKEELHAAIKNRAQLNSDDILAKVQEKLPGFGKSYQM